VFTRLVTLVLVLVLSPPGAVADSRWLGAPPDCWAEPRLFHGAGDASLWQTNVRIVPRAGSRLGDGELSPNKGYRFAVAESHTTVVVTVDAERDGLTEIRFTNVYGLSDRRWINEKLVFLRVWWGRIAGTDFIYDAEKRRMVYAETVHDGTIAWQQFRESCPTLGCDCIRKR